MSLVTLSCGSKMFPKWIQSGSKNCAECDINFRKHKQKNKF
nr:MAG TPA: NINTH ZINC-FINGER DOMAIN OF THE-finger, beta-hairpin + alpha-helix, TRANSCRIPTION [Caudoviricetes sp.]